MSADDDGTGPSSREGSGHGERLAAWLEELHLDAHLAEAGLPTFTRGADGVAWTDPRTGGRLDDEQLDRLEALLRRDGDEPAHAVPVPLVQLRRRARLREELLASAWFTYETLAEVRGTSVDATRFAVHKAAAAHRLLVVAADERTLVPAFQLTADGEVRADLLPVLEPLLAARLDPWRAWAWLTRPAALLGGLVPEQAVTRSDGDDRVDRDLVLHAAVRLAERL